MEGGDKYLTFKLGREDFAIELRRVREIMPLVTIAKVPLSPDYVRGVFNLRGRVIPVVDLRRKFAMPAIADNDRQCIVVCDVIQESVTLQASILVDAVSEVLHIDKTCIDRPPLLGAHTDTSFLLGVAKLEGHVKFLLDIDVIFSANTLSLAALTLAAPA